MDLEHYKKIVDKKGRERERLIGQKEQLTRQLSDLGFDTIKEAEDYLDELSSEITKMEKQFEKKKLDFEKKYKDKLEKV
jgi:recombinational DNA repair ATPase RecF